MKIYIVDCGMYEASHNALVTTDYSKALEFAFSRYNYRGNDKHIMSWEQFEHLEIWEDDVLLYEYGGKQSDIINSYDKLTLEELDTDIKRHIKQCKCFTLS